MGIQVDWIDQMRPAVMQFCEETLSTIPKHPADTWSNIGPIIAGVWIVVRARQRALPLQTIGYASIAAGVFSGVYHATNTYVGEVMDIAGMYAFIFACASVQLYRDKTLSSLEATLLAATLAVVGTVLAAYSDLAKTPLFAVVLIVVAYNEITAESVKNYRYAYAALGAFAVAFTFWVLDYSRCLCDPQNHVLTGHGVWHLLCGVAFYLTYRQFATSVTPRQAADDAAPPN
ncbi:MAG: ceramidase domain-containing protein [Planctomycetota bacterium]